MSKEGGDTRKSDANSLNIGDKWSRHSYGTVVGRDYYGTVVENETGMQWKVSKNIFEAEFNVASQYREEVKLSRTDMVDKIVSSARLVMTVHFRKKPEHKDLVTAVIDLLDGKIDRPASKRGLSMLLKKATDGEERTMVGRHYGTKDDFGRLQFTEMKSGGGLRLIDPRTVEWAIIDNVKYVLKK